MPGRSVPTWPRCRGCRGRSPPTPSPPPAAGPAAAFVVSPNNPTGSVLTRDDLEQVAAAAPHVVLDAAYGEFADTDLSPAALGLGNTVVVRTLSKAYGLAGLRVGYLLGPPDLVARIGAQGGPYPVSALSAAMAEARLGLPGKRSTASWSRSRRAPGADRVLDRLGTTPFPSQANFVLSRCSTPRWRPRRARSMGIALRRFADRPGMEDMVRISLPGERADFARLVAVLETVLAPRKGRAMTRTATVTRRTSEVDVTVRLDLDGEGRARVATGLGFLDHMLGAFARHGRFDLEVDAAGDLAVDDHHTVEDCAIALGRAIHQALGDRSGIARFGHAYAPLDESLARAVVDLSGRPWPEIDIPFAREMIGQVATENLVHFLRSFAMEGRMALHVDLIRGDNDHHRAEASFKAVAMALRAAVAGAGSGVPSTKGTLT